MRATKYGSMGSGGYEGMICVDGRSDLGCGTVLGAANRFTMCVPAIGDFAFRMIKTGYETVLVPIGQDMIPPQYGIEAGNDEFVSSQYWSPIGATYPPTTQSLLSFVVVKRDANQVTYLEGAQISLTPSLPVIYVDDMFMPDMTATATNGMAAIALVANVPPGTYDVKVTSGTHPNCTNAMGGGFVSPLADHQLRIAAVAGATVSVVVECRP